MIIEIQAKVKKLGEIETVGQQGQYQKRDLVLYKPWSSQDGSRSGENLYAIEYFGQQVDNISNTLSEGEEVVARCKVESKEWNGRYFTKLSGYGELSYISRGSSTDHTPAPGAFSTSDPIASGNVSEAEEDDLPF